MLLNEAQSLREGDVVWEVCCSLHDEHAFVQEFLFIRGHCNEEGCDLLFIGCEKTQDPGNPFNYHIAHASNIYRNLDSAKIAAVARMLQCPVS